MTSKKVCENCNYEHADLFEEPCRDCVIETNSLWRSKDDKNNPKD